MTGARLHLIRPFGFYLDEKALRRAGMDYWPKIDVTEYDCFQDFIEKNPSANIYLAESGIGITYTDVEYKPGDFIIFGSETKGLPQSLLEQYKHRIINIPMIGEERSLNLSVTAGIVLYEALRQQGFPGLTGELLPKKTNPPVEE